MDVLEKAIIFAVKAHSGAFRKGTTTPYIVHPLEACFIASTITDDKEVIASAVLHDVLEDTDTTKDELIKEFGEKIAKLVASDSEDKMVEIPPENSWRIRKQATLDFLDSAKREEQIICLADKLSNMRAIYRDYNRLGDKLWERFNQKEKNKHAWYYGEIAKRLTLLKNTDAYKEYIELLDKTFK